MHVPFLMSRLRAWCLCRGVWGVLGAWLLTGLLGLLTAQAQAQAQTQGVTGEVRPDSAQDQAAVQPQAPSEGTEEEQPVKAFDIKVQGPEKLRDYVNLHMDLKNYQSLTDLDRIELDRLLLAARDNIKELLATQGYFSPNVEIHAQDNPTNTEHLPPWTVNIQIEPGEPVRIRSVRLNFIGAIENSAVHEEEFTEAQHERDRVRAAWTLLEGKIFTQAQWDSAKTEALRVLSANRYAAARIKESNAWIDPQQHSADLYVELDSGPAFVFGTLQVQGLKQYEALLVERLAQLKPGTPYSQKRLLQAQQRIADGGYFDSVFMSLDTHSDPQAATIKVQVVEAKLQKMVLGVGANTDSGARFSAEHTHRKLPWIDWKSVSKLSLDHDTQTLNTELTSQPDAKNWRWITSAQIQRQEGSIDPTNSVTLRGGRIKSDEFFDRSMYLQYDFSRTQASNEPEENAAAISANYNWTRRNFDNVPYPRSGYGLNTELGGGVTLRERRDVFVRTKVRWLGYHTLGSADDPERTRARTSTLVARLEGGAVLTRNGALIPSTQLFLTGGDTTVRGYSYQAIGIPQNNGSVDPGRYLGVSSLEWQRPLILKERVSEFDTLRFVDAGTVTNRLSDLRIDVGVGTGMRWRSPVGPLEVALAWGVTPRRFRLHMNVGFTF